MAKQSALTRSLKGYRPRPVLDKVLVKPFEADEKTEGGIVLPESAQEKPRCGQVLALGPGLLLEDGSRSPFDAKVEDIIVFSQYAGVEVQADGETFLILRNDEITCVLDAPCGT